MTNYNQRLDDILEDFYDGDIRQSDMGKAKQALTSLIKELVEEAKPEKKSTEDYGSWEEGHRNVGWNNCLEQFEQNLLKVLEEV